MAEASLIAGILVYEHIVDGCVGLGLVLRLSLRISYYDAPHKSPVSNDSRPRHRYGVIAAVAGAALVVTACGAGSPAAASPGVINAIGTENEYANVMGQIGGSYVHVSSILNNPNTDPHTYEASPSVAQEVSAAQLIVQNGVGYDNFMNTIESGRRTRSRKVLIVQDLLGCRRAPPTHTSGTHPRRCRRLRRRWRMRWRRSNRRTLGSSRRSCRSPMHR